MSVNLQLFPLGKCVFELYCVNMSASFVSSLKVTSHQMCSCCANVYFISMYKNLRQVIFRSVGFGGVCIHFVQSH